LGDSIIAAVNMIVAMTTLPGLSTSKTQLTSNCTGQGSLCRILLLHGSTLWGTFQIVEFVSSEKTQSNLSQLIW